MEQWKRESRRKRGNNHWRKKSFDAVKKKRHAF